MTKNFFNRKIFLISIIIILFYSIPHYKNLILSGLDNSWVFAINLGFDKWQWGTDVVFTYGPLGMIMWPQEIGSNFNIAFIFWIFIFLLNIVGIFIFYIENKQNINYFSILSTVILFLFATGIFLISGGEYHLVYISVLFISLSIWSKNKRIRKFSYILVNIFFLFSVFIKFSCAIIIGSSLFLCLLTKIFLKENFKFYIQVFLINCVFIIINLFLYSGSFAGGLNYIKSAIDISSGYNIAMSSSQNDRFAILAVFLVLLYIFLAFAFYKQNKKLTLYMLSFSGALFFAFKHAFVRADGHILIFFCFYLLLLHVVILFVGAQYRSFIKIEKEKISDNSIIFRITSKLKLNIFKKNCFLLIAIVLCYLIFNQTYTEVEFWKYNTIQTKPTLIKNFIISQNSSQFPAEGVLEDNIIVELGDKNTTIFPLEISYVAFNDINYVPMPVFQTYSAYTSHLDKLNLEFFESEEAPEYIIFEYKAIDNRHPLLDVPATWKAIYDNYKPALLNSNMALFQKKENSNNEKTYLSTITIDKEALFEIPKSDRIIISEIDLNLSLIGKVTAFLWKIPEVKMEITYEDGTSTIHRIVPDTLQNGFIANQIPDSLISTNEMLNGNRLKEVTKLQFSGPGLKYYKKNMSVEFYETEPNKKISDYQNNILCSRSDVSIKALMGNCTGALDYIGIYPAFNDYFYIHGWANVENTASETQNVYIEFVTNNESVIYGCNQTLRQDVALHFNSDDYKNSGYEMFIETEELKHLIDEDAINGRIIVEINNQYYLLTEFTISNEMLGNL